jgi:predicted anti-sigma-YlaC factor YlaD
MGCFEVQAELERYVDGELGPERTALLEGHLAGCEGCRAELARLEAVVAAVETWPLVAEPAQFTEGVMARVRPRPVLPGFRIQWSDLAISLAGASLVFAALLLWRYLAATDLASLYRMQMSLRLGVLRLQGLLLVTRCLARTGTPSWGLVLVGVVLVTAVPLVVWDLVVGRREALVA